VAEQTKLYIYTRMHVTLHNAVRPDCHQAY